MGIETGAELGDEGSIVGGLGRGGVLEIDIDTVKTVVLEQLDSRRDEGSTGRGGGDEVEVT